MKQSHIRLPQQRAEQGERKQVAALLVERGLVRRAEPEKGIAVAIALDRDAGHGLPAMVGECHRCENLRTKSGELLLP